MNEVDAISLVQSAIWTILLASMPAIGAGMIVGVTIALFQALTQVQEITLTFIPKIVAILLVAALAATFTGSKIQIFTTNVYEHIEYGF